MMHFINMGTFSRTPKEVSDWLINPVEEKETCCYIVKEWEVTVFQLWMNHNVFVKVLTFELLVFGFNVINK
ncbi:hypothetical protein SLEP1_g12744 [Rubroshorea leprosula]|uniref:Uncharacterized protein n=1 Tax=Rubroshorea leprosula TaxID=152421 RepID=A0AAV5IDH5_9ROSI|nr:hypothetical protein SLEP1_g12744 [Rubroshorea leprosula]